MVMSNEEFKALVAAAAKWADPPTGQYPWHAKKQYKSVATPVGVGLEEIPQPEFESTVTQFIPVDEIEMPDPSLIHVGEVAQYVNALSPVIMTKDLDANGKKIILDGRHRLAAWRAAGYKIVPVVFVKVTPLPKFIQGME